MLLSFRSGYHVGPLDCGFRAHQRMPSSNASLSIFPIPHIAYWSGAHPGCTPSSAAHTRNPVTYGAVPAETTDAAA